MKRLIMKCWLVLSGCCLMTFNLSASSLNSESLLNFGYKRCTYTHIEEGMDRPEHYKSVVTSSFLPCPIPPAPDVGHEFTPFLFVSSDGEIETYRTTTVDNEKCLLLSIATNGFM